MVASDFGLFKIKIGTFLFAERISFCRCLIRFLFRPAIGAGVPSEERACLSAWGQEL